MIQHEEFRDHLERLGILHGCSDRRERNQGFGYGRKGEVIANRGRFLRGVHPAFQIGAGVGMIWPRPGGEETIAVIGASQGGEGMMAPRSGPACDVMILMPGQMRAVGANGREARYLFVATGDCIPVLMADPVTRTLALVHASRESLLCAMPRQAVEYLGRYAGVDPENLVVLFGPGIRTYELEHLTAASDGDRQDGLRDYVTPNAAGTGVLFDLFGFARHLVVSAGVPDSQIYEFAEIDTLTDERFASHRRAKMTGEPEWRHAAVIGFAPDD